MTAGRGYAGTGDVLRANGAMLDAMGACEVLVEAADHIYSMDYRHFVATHQESGAPLTLAAMPVPREEASRFGVVTEGPGVRLSNVIVAPGTVIPHGMQIGDDPEEDHRWFRVSGSTTLVTSATLARQGAPRTPVFSVLSGPRGLFPEAQRVT